MIDPGFTTLEMAAIFAPERRVAALLEFEAALARATAHERLIPDELSNEIARACRDWNGDPEPIVSSTWQLGTPLIALLESLRPRLSQDGASALHHGATSQDAIDTGLVLQIKEACLTLEGNLKVVGQLLRALSEEHRKTPFLARTLMQDAAPTTFGLRAAQWLDPLLRSLVDLASTRSSLPVQLGGPVGNLDAFGASGPSVLEALAKDLGLAAPATPWHTDRSHIRLPVEAGLSVALAMDKIASDLVLLASFGEVRMRPGGSSSMGHKRNPIDAVRALAAVRACIAAASALTAPGGRELERGVGAWQVEWWAVPLVFESTAASVEAVGDCLRSLEVDVDVLKQRGAGIEQETLTAASALIDRVLAASSVLA